MDPRYLTYNSMTNGAGNGEDEADSDEDGEEEGAEEPEERRGGSTDDGEGQEEEDEEEEVEEYVDEGRPDDVAELARRAAALPTGMQPVYRALTMLMSPENHVYNWPFMNAVDSKSSTLWDYAAVIKTPMWLKKIREKLLQQEYDSPTAVFADVRLMLRNCYRYNGPQHSVTRRALRLEHIMEQLIEQFEPELRQQCTLEATEGADALVDPKIVHRRRSVRNKTPGFFSHVLHWVRHERTDREREFKRQQLEAKRQQRQEKENSIVAWEERLLKGQTGDWLQAMWELPQVAQFVHLSLRALNIFEVPLYEMERMLLVPQSSETLGMLMTSLVSGPLIRTKLSEMPPMPYTMWSEKLAARVQLWYRAYAKEAGRTDRLHDTQGIEPDFWRVVGTTNPFETKMFHQLSFYQRVWMVKTMCDFLFHNRKTVQECVMEASLTEPRERVVGVDRHGYEYVHFPHLFVQDVRLYRRRPWHDLEVWNAEPPAPPPPPPPLRASELGGGWSRARLEKFRRHLSQLRRGSGRRGGGGSGHRRPTAVRRVFTCLGGAATPAGSPSHSDEEDSEAEDDSSEEEAKDDGPEFTLTRSGRKSQRPRRSGSKKAAAAAAAATPAASETASRRGRGRAKGKGRQSSSRASTPARQPPATPAADQSVCPHCGMSIRSQRARKAHRCPQEQQAQSLAAADDDYGADSASPSEASVDSDASDSDSPVSPPPQRSARGRSRRSRGRSAATEAPSGRGRGRGTSRPSRRGRSSGRRPPPDPQPKEETSRTSADELSRLSAPELESVGDELSRLSAGGEELAQRSPPRLAPVSPPVPPADSSGAEEDSRMEVDQSLPPLPSLAENGAVSSDGGPGSPPAAETPVKTVPAADSGTQRRPETGTEAMEVDGGAPQSAGGRDGSGADGDGVPNGDFSGDAKAERTAAGVGPPSPAAGGRAAGEDPPISGRTASESGEQAPSAEPAGGGQNGVTAGGDDRAGCRQESDLPCPAQVKLEPSKESTVATDVKTVTADVKKDTSPCQDDVKRTDFNGVVDKLKGEPVEQKPAVDSVDTKPVCVKSEPCEEAAAADSTPIKQERPADGAGSEGTRAGAEPQDGELAVPELVPEPEHLSAPDPDQFQLVASTFDSLRKLVDAFDPDAETSSKKGQKPPDCEVELHKALKKILDELEPLETKINQSVRRMRKRLCQEWLNYIERPADFEDPNEAAWVEPDQQPEPASKTADRSPSLSPEPSDEEELMDADGRRKQRSRRAKRKRVNYCVDGGSGAAAGDAKDTETWQMSSRGRVRKVRKMDDFAYEETEDNSRDRSPADDDFSPEGSTAASPSKMARPGGGGGPRSSADRDATDWESYRQRMLQREQARRSRPTAATPRPARITEPSPAWNSELPILNENLDDRVSRIRSQIQRKIACRPTVYGPRSEASVRGARRPAGAAGTGSLTSAAGASPRTPAGGRVLVNRANLMGGALTKVVHMSGNNSSFVLRMGRDGRVFMDKVPSTSSASTVPTSAVAAGTAAPATATVTAGQGGAAGSAGNPPVVAPAVSVASAPVAAAGAAPRGPLPNSKVAVVLPYKDPNTGTTMYMQLPPDQANSILQSLNLPGLAPTSGATSVSTFSAAVTAAAPQPQPGAPAAVSAAGVRITPAAVAAPGLTPAAAAAFAAVPASAAAPLRTLVSDSAPAAAPAPSSAPVAVTIPAPAPLPASAPALAQAAAPTLSPAVTQAQVPVPTPVVPRSAVPAPAAAAAVPARTLVPAPPLLSPPATVTSTAAAVVHPPHRSVLMQHVQSLPIAPGAPRPTLREPPPPPIPSTAPAPAPATEMVARVKAALQQVQAQSGSLNQQQAQRLASRVMKEQRAAQPPAAGSSILQQQLTAVSPRKQQPIRPMPADALSRAVQSAQLGSPGRTLVTAQPTLLAVSSPPTLIAGPQPALLASPLSSAPSTLLAVSSPPALLSTGQQPAFLASGPALLTGGSGALQLTGGSGALQLVSSPAPLVCSPPTVLMAAPALAVTTAAPSPRLPAPAPAAAAPRPAAAPALVGRPALLASRPAAGPPPMQRAPRYVSSSVQFVGGSSAAAAPASTSGPGPRPRSTQQGKVVIIKSGTEQKLGVLMPNGQIVELTEKQANNVKMEALKQSGRPDPPS